MNQNEPNPNPVTNQTGSPQILSLADQNGRYATPQRPRNWLARLLPSVFFYTSFVLTVLRYSRIARQHRYDDANWYQSGLDVLRSLEKTGVQIRISGLNNLRKIEGACVFVANHMSTLETVVLPAMVQPYKDCTFIIKRGIAEYPIFKHIILERQPIVVDRVNPREDLMRVLKEGEAMLKAGRSIIVFPQTTRTTKFDPSRFNTMAVKLARSAGVPVVPIAVRSDAWGIGRVIKEFGKVNPDLPVHFAFGNAIPVEGRGTAAHQAVIEFIAQELRSWGSTVVDRATGDAPSVGNEAATA